VEGAQGADLVTGARFCDCHSHSLGRLRKTRLRDKSLPQRLKAVTDSERLSRPWRAALPRYYTHPRCCTHLLPCTPSIRDIHECRVGRVRCKIVRHTCASFPQSV